MDDVPAILRPIQACSRTPSWLRRVILNVHMYGGLLCFGFLILFGISVLNFNHPFAFTKSPVSVTTWTMPMSDPKRADGLDVLESLPIRRENNLAILHAMGSFAVPFTSFDGQWIDADTYHAHFVRPGKMYDVDVSGGTATITQTRGSVWSLIRELHDYAGTSYPESVIASSWRWHTEVGTLFVFAAIMSGVYLWIVGRRQRRIGLLVLVAAGAVSIALMILVTVGE